ncbi:hypothetical protein Ga0061062_108148 [Comamonas thiooxydans]|nr:hypothetical protein Ga0061062_108148 [Comamonas thiooxydans]
MTDEPQNFTNSPADQEEQHDDTEAHAEGLGHIAGVELGSGTAELLERLQIDGNLLAIGVRALAGGNAGLGAVGRFAIEDVGLAHCTNSSQLSG